MPEHRAIQLPSKVHTIHMDVLAGSTSLFIEILLNLAAVFAQILKWIPKYYNILFGNHSIVWNHLYLTLECCGRDPSFSIQYTPVHRCVLGSMYMLYFVLCTSLRQSIPFSAKRLGFKLRRATISVTIQSKKQGGHPVSRQCWRQDMNWSTPNQPCPLKISCRQLELPGSPRTF